MLDTVLPQILLTDYNDEFCDLPQRKTPPKTMGLQCSLGLFG
jgi:hypothetical protein